MIVADADPAGWSPRGEWTHRLGTLRNVVRQEVVARQVAVVVGGRVGRAVDVGAGQGTQAIRLARAGWQVHAWDPDERLRAICTRALVDEPADVATRVDVVAGDLDALAMADPMGADLVLCHGVFMYLEDVEEPLAALARHVGAGGVLSVVVRNARALAFRPARRGDWSTARALLDAADASNGDASARPGYVNELGAVCHADDVGHLAEVLATHGLVEPRWFGVRLAVDGIDPDTTVPDDAGELAALLDVEEELGRRDPYRRLAPLAHLVVRRPA